MSTFDGIVDEFPDIRIDHFRSRTDKSPPTACFLSHVHSDHLLGLESLKMPFVYCSATTRHLLLRMEKYPHRINFQKGILEARKQTYRHLRLILRALPLQMPIKIELSPKSTIQVTLFDANHCPGAVMFLIEGDGKAILYTGDVRAESWWVNGIVSNPILLPYTVGHRRLDCLYLDTTFASHQNAYAVFPSKADGMRELLEKLKDCPENSTYYFRAWTLGYEDVWIALSNFLAARVHVNDYQFGLYSSLAESITHLGPNLTGAQVGNNIHPGCLTCDRNVTIHSCEPGMDCHNELARNENLVWITPIISRSSDGVELAELGAGGGGGDLMQTPQLDLNDGVAFQSLRALCRSSIADEEALKRVEASIQELQNRSTFNVSLEGLEPAPNQEITLDQVLDFFQLREKPVSGTVYRRHKIDHLKRRIISFPYSRHSSFTELRDLVSRFRPRDICPCTVDIGSWTEDVSMQSFFGDLCSSKVFNHDVRNRELARRKGKTETSSSSTQKRKRDDIDSQETASVSSDEVNMERDVDNKSRSPSARRDIISSSHEIIQINDSNYGDGNGHMVNAIGRESFESGHSFSGSSLPHEAFKSSDSLSSDYGSKQQQHQHQRQTRSTIREDQRSTTRIQAYQAARATLSDGDYSAWTDLHIRSMGWRGHTDEEMIL